MLLTIFMGYENHFCLFRHIVSVRLFGCCAITDARADRNPSSRADTCARTGTAAAAGSRVATERRLDRLAAGARQLGLS